MYKKPYREKYVSPWTAEKIRDLRMKYGLSQTEFAEKLKVRQQTVSEWELSRYTPHRRSTYILDVFAHEMAALYSTL